MIIRSAQFGDLPEIIDIYNDAVLNTTGTFQEEPDGPRDRDGWLRRHQELKLPILVADDGGVAGWATLSPYHPRSAYRFTAETSVYIKRDRQRQGIGKLLLEKLMEEAVELGLHRLVALIARENHASLRLHAGFGFVEVGALHEVGFKFGRWLDIVFMEARLPEPPWR